MPFMPSIKTYTEGLVILASQLQAEGGSVRIALHDTVLKRYRVAVLVELDNQVMDLACIQI